MDDNLFDQRRIQRMIRDSRLLVTIDTVASIDALAVQLDRGNYDIALLDYTLPIGSGRDAVDLVRRHYINNTCAAVMVAGDDAPDRGAVEMRRACDFFISKDDLSPTLLRSTILGLLSERAMASLQSPSHTHATATATIDAPELETEIESLIRDVRHLRVTTDGDSGALTARLSNLEQRSIRAWTALRQTVKTKRSTGPFDLLNNLDQDLLRRH